MNENVTKDDLRELRILLLNDIEKILETQTLKGIKPDPISIEWVRSKIVRQQLCISPATLQNLRITGKIRYKKLMGSYYYSKADILKLFKD